MDLLASHLYCLPNPSSLFSKLIKFNCITPLLKTLQEIPLALDKTPTLFNMVFQNGAHVNTCKTSFSPLSPPCPDALVKKNSREVLKLTSIRSHVWRGRPGSAHGMPLPASHSCPAGSPSSRLLCDFCQEDRSVSSGLS